tara:strand:+ start:293 stop:757 length:465 start_codon:yes stop_codon:yes gene_type:complete
MFLKFKNHLKLLYLFLFIILSNCQLKESTNTHGILFLENRTNKLTVNKSNKNDVIDIIGQPHSKSIDNDNEWMYIERVFVKGDYHKLGQNILKSNNVLLLEFNKFGVLKNKKLFNKDDINKIAFSEKITENDLSKRSFVEKLFSSLKSKMYGKK